MSPGAASGAGAARIVPLAFFSGTPEDHVWAPRLDGFMLVKEMSYSVWSGFFGGSE